MSTTRRDDDAVKARLAEVFGSPPVRDAATPWGLVYRCPECPGGDARGHLGVNLAIDRFHCVKCGWGGRISQLVGTKRRLLRRSAPRFDAPAVPLPSLFWRMRRVRPDGQVARHVWAYLQTREVDLDAFEVGVAASLPGYAVFVDRLPNGRAVYWQGVAALRCAGRKAMNPNSGADVPKAALIGVSRVPAGAPVVLVEGVFDAAKLPNAAAILGKSMTAAQVRRLAVYAPSRVTVFLDGDAPREAAQLARYLSAGLGDAMIRVVTYPAADRRRDPGDMTREEAAAMVGRARDVTDPADLAILLANAKEDTA